MALQKWGCLGQKMRAGQGTKVGREGGIGSAEPEHCANCQPRTGLLLDSYWICHHIRASDVLEAAGTRFDLPYRVISDSVSKLVLIMERERVAVVLACVHINVKCRSR